MSQVFSGATVSLSALIQLQGQTHGLSLAARRKVFALQSGGYTTTFRGRGVDFDEVRHYQPGDEIRHLDWRVTARTGKPHTRLYHEERERPVIFLLDLGPSMYFGSRVAFKSVIAAQGLALLAWTAINNGDRVGALLSANGQHHEFAPRSRKQAILPVLNQVAQSVNALPTGAAAGHTLAASLTRLLRLSRPGSLIFVVSDCYTLDTEAERLLARLALHNEVVMLLIEDAIEQQAPPPARYPVTDGRQFAWFENRSGTQSVYLQALQARRERLQQLCYRCRMTQIPLATHQAVTEVLRTHLAVRR